MRLLALLAAFVAFQGWWFQRETPTEKRLAAVAGSIAKADVEVRCPSIWRRLLEVSSVAGRAHWDENGRPTHAELEHRICKTFDRILETGFPEDVGCLGRGLAACDEPARDAAVAVHILSHEAWHLAGVVDEGIAQCYAYQTDAEVARDLGAGDAQAQLIALAMIVGGSTAALPQYRPPSDCRPGGRYDLSPGSGSWPSR